jgi:cytochrome c biogenesis protein CcmG/thiol:disulfide interchange protein DsbE
MKKLTIAIMLAAAVAAAGCLQGKDQRSASPAPDFSVRDLQGRLLTLADYKGKVLILNFWATWCPPCRVEIPDFIETYKNLKDQGLEVLGLSVDNLPVERLREWIDKAGVNYPVALASPEIIEAYEPGDYIPVTIVVDRKGRVRFRRVGVVDKETLARLFKEYSD